MWCRYNAVRFLTNIYKSYPIAHPSYGVYFVDPSSDWYSALVPVMSQLISYNIGPRYNGTSLYYALYDLIPCLFLDYYCNHQYRMLDYNECIKYVPKSTPTLSIWLPLNNQARLLHFASSLSLCMIWPYCLSMIITVFTHYNGVIMSTTASQITSLTIVYSTFIQAQIKESIKARVTGLCVGFHRWPVNSPHNRPVTRKMVPFDGVVVVT